MCSGLTANIEGGPFHDGKERRAPRAVGRGPGNTFPRAQSPESMCGRASAAWTPPTRREAGRVVAVETAGR